MVVLGSPVTEIVASNKHGDEHNEHDDNMAVAEVRFVKHTESFYKEGLV